MRILMLTPILPYPLYSGGQIRLFNLLKNLGKRHEISLFSFIRQEEEKKYLPEILKYCQKVEVFKKRKPWSLTTLFKTATSFYPLLMMMYHFPGVKKRIGQEIKAGNYDLIHVECFYTISNLPKTSRPVILTEQNIEYLVYQRFVKNFPFWPAKPFLYFDVLKIKFWEKYFWQRADKIIAVSEEENQIINLPQKTSVVENGVDSSYFGQKFFGKKWSEVTVVFVGNFRWVLNQDAVSFLVKEIWPHIKENLPEVRLWVVGKDMPKRLKDLVGKAAQISEGIEDIREAYQGADLLLAPIRIGGGTSYKILEAMASGLPVVTTPLGIAGIEAKKEVMVGKNSQELAQLVVDLLKNEEKRRAIGERARKLVKEKYDWQKISQKLERVWEEARQK